MTRSDTHPVAKTQGYKEAVNEQPSTRAKAKPGYATGYVPKTAPTKVQGPNQSYTNSSLGYNNGYDRDKANKDTFHKPPPPTGQVIGIKVSNTLNKVNENSPAVPASEAAPDNPETPRIQVSVNLYYDQEGNRRTNPSKSPYSAHRSANRACSCSIL